MRSFASAFTLLAVSAGLVAADTPAAVTSAAGPAVATSGSGGSAYKCAAQNIVDSCLVSMKPQLAACKPEQWDCLCEQSNNVLTCYNNCPNHPEQFGAEQTKTSYCNAAKAYGTTTTKVSTSTESSSSSSKTDGSSATKPSSSTETSTSSDSDSDSDGSSSSFATKSLSGFQANNSEGAAAGLAVEAGSLLAAVLLGVGAAL